MSKKMRKIGKPSLMNTRNYLNHLFLLVLALAVVGLAPTLNAQTKGNIEIKASMTDWATASGRSPSSFV